MPYVPLSAGVREHDEGRVPFRTTPDHKRNTWESVRRKRAGQVVRLGKSRRKQAHPSRFLQRRSRAGSVCGKKLAPTNSSI